MNLNIISVKEIGGKGGHEFDTCAEGRVRGFHIRSGAWIDAVQLVYTNALGQEDSTQRFGGQGGNLKTFMLEPGERVTCISLTADNRYVHSISIETSLNNQVTFGLENGEPVAFEIPENHEFAGFYGKCSSYIDSLGILIAESIKPF